jgi:hypothetical protein
MKTTRGRVLGTITHKMRIEKVRPTFTPLASISQLDLKKVAAKSKTDIELGYLSSGLCRQMVRASVKKGIVTGIRLEPCTSKKTQRPSPEILQLVRKAQRAVGRTGPSTPLPIAIDRFLPQAARIIIETITCFRICVFYWCIYCCTTTWDGLVCGSDVVVMPPIIIYD